MKLSTVLPIPLAVVAFFAMTVKAQEASSPSMTLQEWFTMQNKAIAENALSLKGISPEASARLTEHFSLEAAIAASEAMMAASGAREQPMTTSEAQAVPSPSMKLPDWAAMREEMMSSKYVDLSSEVLAQFSQYQPVKASTEACKEGSSPGKALRDWYTMRDEARFIDLPAKVLAQCSEY